jgi:hypothetical protein
MPGVTPTPGGPPATPPPGMYCWDCVPWPYCPSGFSNNYCVVYRANGTFWVHSWSCAPTGECEDEPPPPGDDPGDDPPCIPEYNADGIDIRHCNDDPGRGYEWGYEIYVSASVPAHRVQVDPFPRWLVAMGAPLPEKYDSGSEGRLTLQDYPAYTPPGLCYPHGPGFSEGCWSDTVALPEREPDEEPEEGDIRNYRIGLRWRRIDMTDGEDLGGTPAICWDFNEREWNIGADYGYGPIPAMECGTAVTHIYETSSWGLPRNGPRFILPAEACGSWEDHCCEQVPSGDGEWDMPAYQVRVPTYWSAQWKVEWEVYEEIYAEGECQCHGGSGENECTGEPGLCLNAPVTEHWVWVEESVYDWVEYEDGWHALDLRNLGYNTWYYTSWAVVTTGEGPWCNWEYGDPNPGDTVRVPVIEIQSVLRDPCVIDGSCPPGYP